MLKKFTAIFFITLASMIMHTFAAIPHHHHLNYICFNSNHCETNLPVDQHSHDNEDNNNPAHPNHGCIRNLFQTQISRIESLTHSCAEGHCHHFIFIPFLVPDQLLLLSLEAEELAESPIVYREKLHVIYYISSISGRDPPKFEC